MIIKPSVYTIPADQSFLNTLAAGIYKKYAQTTESLLSVTIFLPTRRACRSLCDSFLELTNGRPTFLPKMKPLGDIDDDDLSLSNTNAANVLSSLEIAPPISNLQKLLKYKITIPRKVCVKCFR